MSNFEIKNLDQAADVARVFSKSSFFKDARQFEQAMVKVIAGAELGMGPFQAMNSFHVIQGKVEMGGGAIAARIKASAKYDYRVIEKTSQRCEIAFFQDGEELGREVWDMRRAKAAELTGNHMYRKYPEAMLFNRTIASGYRTYCPDIFSFSVYAEGEIRDAVAVEVEPVRQEPRRRPTPRQGVQHNTPSPTPPVSPISRDYVLTANDFSAKYAGAIGKTASDHKWANIALNAAQEIKDEGDWDKVSEKDQALVRIAYRVLRDDYAKEVRQLAKGLDDDYANSVAESLGLEMTEPLEKLHPFDLKKIRDALRKESKAEVSS